MNYTPDGKGPMVVQVTYGGDEIPNSPFHVNVAPSMDIDKVIVRGLADGMYCNW